MKKIIVAFLTFALSSVVLIHAQDRTVLLNGEPVLVTTGQAGRGFVVTTGPAQRGIVVPLEARIVKGAPYSAEIVTESIQTLADGNRIVQRTTGRVSRDSEGRVRREEDRPSGGPTISITDSGAGTTFRLDPANRTARETSFRLFELTQAFRQLTFQGAVQTAAGSLLAPRDWSAAPPPPPQGTTGRGGRGGRGGDEQSDERLQDRVVEGVLASGVRRTTTINRGAIGNEQPIRIVSEEWTSPELQVLVMTDHTDPRTGRSTYRLLKISRLDPDPTLFQVPADYTVQRMPGGRGGRGARGQ